jgi:hypothetical protein
MDQLRPQLSRVIRRRAGLLAGVALSLATACGENAAHRAHATVSTIPGEGGSPFSLDSAITLFRRGLHPVTELQNGEASIDAIVARLLRAVEQSDTAALRDMVMSRAEFAYLYYPTSVHTRPPMKQEPGLAWFLHLQHSEKGVSRLVNRYGGAPLHLSNTCAPPKAEGENRLYFDCVQRVVAAGGRDTTVIRLFGGIYERGGRFKIFSYSNDL